jgi:hypothetical protein
LPANFRKPVAVDTSAYKDYVGQYQWRPLDDVETVAVKDDYAELGDNDHAFIWMNKAADLRSTVLFWVYIYHRQLVSDLRFAAVKQQMSAPQ